MSPSRTPRLTAAVVTALLALGTSPVGAADGTSTVDALAETRAAALAVTGPEDPSSGEDPSVSTDNMSWVASLAYPIAENNSQAGTTDVRGGTDIEITTLTVADGTGGTEERDYAIAGTYENGLQIVDVTEPEAPVLTSTYTCDVYQGDVQVITRDDLLTADGIARSFVTYAVDSSAQSGDCFLLADGTVLPRRTGSFLIEVTDPANPQTVSFIGAAGGTHNMTAHPDGTLLYNSENDAGGQMSIWDISDVTKPVLARTMAIADAGTDTHDVTFYDLDPTDDISADRAYVASIVNSYILDVTDPRDPQLVSRIVDPAIGIHHQADPITVAHPVTGEAATFLIIGDEIAGASGNGYCPGGGLHVFDVTGPLENAPVKVGAYFMPDLVVQEGADSGLAGLTSCTSHVLRMYEDQGIMTIANMAGGVRVLDMTNLIGLSVGVTPDTSTGALAGIADLGYFRFTSNDQRGSDAWSFKAHADRFEEDGSFYAYSNDQTRGFEVYRYEAGTDMGEAGEAGRWASVEQALTRAQQLAPFRNTDALFFSCRLIPQLAEEA